MDGETLVAFLDSDPKKQNHVKGVIEKGGYGKVVLLVPAPLENLLQLGNARTILFDPQLTTTSLCDFFAESLQLDDFEVQVNLICGEGKEHTALLAALIRKGLGFRFAILTADGVKSL